MRFAHAGAGSALTIREIHFAFAAGLGTRSLRELPLGRLEAAANQPEHHAALSGLIAVTDAVVVPFPEDTFTEEGWPWWMYTTVPRRRAPRLTVKIPQGHRKPDHFYEQIAERFAYLATVSPRPATDLAEANGVPVTTVHGWVKEARRRGLLPAGERSRRTALKRLAGRGGGERSGPLPPLPPEQLAWRNQGSDDPTVQPGEHQRKET